MSTITNSTNRVAGLISGLETEELVKAMTANTKMRINSQKQKIQTLQWKQEAYRSIISKITSFQSKYLDLLSPTSIKANSVMKKFVATTSNDKYISATASANAAPAKYTISKTTSAKAATLTSQKGSVASGEIELDFSKAKDGETYTVEINLDGAAKKVTFKGGSSEGVTKNNFLDAVNEAFSGVKGEKQRFAFQPGTNSLYFNGNGDGVVHTFSVGYCSEGLGLENTAYNRISTGVTLAEAGFATKLKKDFGNYDITINGVNFSFDENTTIASMMSTINNSSAGVKMSFSTISQTFTLETKNTGTSASLSVTQSNGNLLNALFGLDEGVAEAKHADMSNPILSDMEDCYMDERSMELGKNLIDQLQNGFEEGKGKYEMLYYDKDGIEHKLTLDLSESLKKGDTTYSDSYITKAFNDAFKAAAAAEGIEDAGDIFTYEKGELTIRANGCGVDFRIYVEDSVDGAFADGLRNGFKNGDAEDPEYGKYKFTYTDSKGDSYDLEIDMKKALEDVVPEGEDGTYTASQISKALNKAAKEAYIEKSGMSEEDAEDFSINFSYTETKDEDGNVTGGTFRRLDDANKDFNLLHNIQKTVGHADASKVVNDATQMTFTVNKGTEDEYTIEIKRDGKNITILRDGEEIYNGDNEKEGITIKNLVDAGLVTLYDGVLFAAKDVTAEDIDAQQFFVKYFTKCVDPVNGDFTIERSRVGELETARGSNATITVSSDDGKTFATYTSTSNSFTFDGTTITIAGDFAAEGADDYITVETKKDNSGIMDVVKGFVEDYNNLLADLYGEITTTRPKSSGSYYDPLTEEQEEEMSDKEIEKWNENAKTGLLYQDSNIQKFLSQLRGVMNTRVDGFGLADMGIKLTSSWNDRGKLEIDESKLESAIESMGDKVANLFTGANGLSSKLEAVVDKAVSTKTKQYGYLSALAGIEGTKTDTDNQIYKQIDYIQKILERLNTKYENEQERYWRKYSKLETMMQRAQTQMSYFMDYGSSY